MKVKTLKKKIVSSQQNEKNSYKKFHDRKIKTNVKMKEKKKPK